MWSTGSKYTLKLQKSVESNSTKSMGILDPPVTLGTMCSTTSLIWTRGQILSVNSSCGWWRNFQISMMIEAMSYWSNQLSSMFLYPSSGVLGSVAIYRWKSFCFYLEVVNGGGKKQGKGWERTIWWWLEGPKGYRTFVEYGGKRSRMNRREGRSLMFIWSMKKKRFWVITAMKI